MNKTATIIINSQLVPLGTLESVLAENDFELIIIDATNNDITSLLPTESDLVIVLGGPQSPYEYKKYPYLLNEINFLKKRLQHDLPTIGIALGAQLIAYSQGSRAIPGHQKGLPITIGWSTLTINNDLLAMFGDNKVLLWQNDYYEPPIGSVSLATASPYGCQAFQVGRNCFGFQFHAEVTLDIVTTWLENLNEDLQIAGVNNKALSYETSLYIDEMKKQSTKLWQHLIKHWTKT